MTELDHITTWIFDLDNTLYRGDTEFFSQIDVKMTTFISEYLKLPRDEARIIQKQFLADYGTSLSGLMQEHNMPPDEFLAYVHDIDLSALTPDPGLRTQIKNLPGRKFIFTNGTRYHAQNVGTHLKLYDLFNGAFGIEDADYVPKPNAQPYDMFCARFDIDPRQAIMFEDSVKNLKVPKAMGMATVLVSSGVDWFYDAAIAHPEKNITGDWIDFKTDDLTAWLQSHT